MDKLHYTDLLKAHKFFCDMEKRYRFYDAYMAAKDSAAWFMSPQVPLKEGLLLFGWVHTWDPNFKGDLARILEIYSNIFPNMKNLENESLIDIDFSSGNAKHICLVFDSIANCCKSKRYESTDASKMLHVIIPKLFVMWDDNIRANLVGGRRDGKCYAEEFMPRMQELARQLLEGYIQENGGDYDSASDKISQLANNHTLAKLIDEFNYLRFTWKKTLSEIRSISLSVLGGNNT